MCYIYKLSLMFNTKPKHHKKTWKKLITYSQPLHTQSHPSGKKKKKNSSTHSDNALAEVLHVGCVTALLLGRFM